MRSAVPPNPTGYYAVVFTSERTGLGEGYEETAARMLELAARQDGYMGVDSVREGTLGITVSYWRDLAAIRDWKAEFEHLDAQRAGRDKWYERYRVRICRVEREYAFERSRAL